jgi:hypothetical protein
MSEKFPQIPLFINNLKNYQSKGTYEVERTYIMPSPLLIVTTQQLKRPFNLGVKYR